MKKLIVSMAVLAAFVATSCGDDKESDDKSSGPSLCDCVNEKEASDDCKEMKKEWEEKYKDASDEEKEEMMDEVKECMAKAE